MDKQKRKELLEQYKQMKTYMGVVQITNLVNKKIFIASYQNLKNQWLTIKMQLDQGRFANLELQKDWKEFGEENFTYEVLEEEETEDVSDVRWEIKQMKKAWLDKLEPYGEKGYNKPEK